MSFAEFVEKKCKHYEGRLGCLGLCCCSFRPLYFYVSLLWFLLNHWVDICNGHTCLHDITLSHIFLFGFIAPECYMISALCY